MITVTKTAAQQILAAAPPADTRLRVAAKRLPDGTFDYAFGWDTPSQHDTRSNEHGVEIIVAPTSVELLRGATLDYVELAHGEHRFIVLNPNDPNYIPPKK